MAALPKFRRIQRDDVKSAPEWINGMLYILNGFMETIYYALSHNLTFTDNFMAYEKVFQIKAGAAATNNTYQFLLPQSFTVKPTGLLVIGTALVTTTYTPVASAVFCSWRFSNNQMLIDAISGLTSGQTYNITLLVF